MIKKPKILVIGSINIDYVSYLTKFPDIGETLTSNNFSKFHGGKGANQAIAAKRLSLSQNHVSLFAKVQGSSTGQSELDHLIENGIDSKYIFKSKAETGSAIIFVSDKEKDNMIVINNGANEDFSKNDLIALRDAISDHDHIVFQLETNDFLVENGLKISKELGKTVFMNPAPAFSFKKEWLEYIDWFIPNETELEHISNHKTNSIEEINKALIKLEDSGLNNAIVTLGGEGVYVYSAELKELMKTKKLTPVDTTAAGDTFIGTFSANYQSMNIKELVLLSMKASSFTIMKKGAQESIPTIKEVQNEKN